MKRIIGMVAAAVLVLLQLGAIVALREEAPLDLSPINGRERVREHRA